MTSGLVTPRRKQKQLLECLNVRIVQIVRLDMEDGWFI